MRFLKPLLCPTSGANLLLQIITAMQASAWAFGFSAVSTRTTSTSPPAVATQTGSKVLPVPTLLLPKHKAKTCGVTMAASESRVSELGGRRCSALWMAKAAKDAEVVLKSVKAGPLKQENIELPSGVSMQMVSQKPSTGSPQRSKPPPPLVFIHGSYHAAWCWAEHWMPFLASRGYETYSISLRGTSGTVIPGAEAEAKGTKVKIADHVADIRSFAETALPGRRPVYISHSFGGVVLLKLMEQLAEEAPDGGNKRDTEKDAVDKGMGIRAAMAGGAFLCSVPPSGNGPMTKRFIKERPVMAVKIVVGFVLKMAVYWPWLARDLFFCQSLEQSALKRYMSSFKADSKNGLDLLDLRTQLPITNADEEGRATWLRQAPPRLVLGAERDRIVDEAGIKEMATFLDTEHIMLPTVPHEVMLGPDWPLGVARLLQWLEATDFAMSSTP
ncbi:unnamed protein product [Pylaiella littoralis]